MGEVRVIEAVIPKGGLACDCCGEPLTYEDENGRVRMRKDGILTEWGLYCVRCYLKYGVRIKKGYEIQEHIEGGTDITESQLMKPIIVGTVELEKTGE